MEEQFADELHLFFQYLSRKVLSNIRTDEPLESLFYGYANDPINQYWTEYEKILSYYVDKAALIGNFHYDLLLEASKDHAKRFQSAKSKDKKRQFLDNRLNTTEAEELYAPNPRVAKKLEGYKFEASEKTKARVNNEINNILAEGYREGWGHRDVADKIQKRFTDLSTYESRRIAQTEINTTRNLVQFNRLTDDGMEYKIWHAAHDARTRKSHLEVDEEIVPIDQPFSNGLMYPGDKSGEVREWVNCRCSHAAYIMPLGYAAPDFWPFTESDLVKVGSGISQDYVSDIQERIRLIDGVMVRETQEEKVEKPVVVEPVEVTPKPKKKPKKPKSEPKPEPVNAESTIARVELQNQFTKDFHTLLVKAEGTSGVELKPIYNKLKKKYKSKVKGRAEFEELFTNAVISTNTRLYPARDPDLKVIFGQGKDKRGFGYIDRSKMQKP